MINEKGLKNNNILTVALVILVSVILFFLFIYLPQQTFPADDALILFRYSENLAQTGVISYNPGGSPVEGATDFLWMVLLAGFSWCGFTVWSGALVLSCLSLLGTGFLVYRLLGAQNKNIFLLILLFLLFSVTNLSSIVGFSTSFFGFFIALTIYLDIKNKSKLVFITALITCLIRPDGLVCVVPVIAHTIIRNRHTIWRTSTQCLLLFFVPGMIYFLWRWNYFGMFFPLSFYVKNSNLLFNYQSFLVNLRFNVPFFIALAFMATCFFYKKKKVNVQWIIFYWVLFLTPFLFYSKVTLLQNVHYRFQHPFVIINLLIMALICKSHAMKKYFIVCLTGLILFSLPLVYAGGLNMWFGKYHSLYHIARSISDRLIDARFVTTEAGIVPYYTNWRTVDAFGLNTPAFTNKVITIQDMREIRPDVVHINYMWTFYDFFDDLQETPEFSIKSWPGMIHNISKGLSKEEYDIWMIPVYDLESLCRDRLFKYKVDFMPYYDMMYYCFFIRKDFARRQEIVDIISSYNAVSYDIFKKDIRPVLEKKARGFNFL